jgi:hypothetical protein
MHFAYSFSPMRLAGGQGAPCRLKSRTMSELPFQIARVIGV